MKKVFLFCLTAAAVSSMAADLMIEDFKNFDKKQWFEWRGGKIEKSEKGAKIFSSGSVTKTRYPGNWKNRPDWDQKYNGIAFKVKGCGSKDYAPVNVIIDYSLSFRWYFPLKSTEWKEYRVHFSDLTAAGVHTFKISPEPGNIPISAFRGICFGDRWTIWHNNAKRVPVNYEVAEFRLITDAKPILEIGKYKPAKLNDFKKNMKAGKKVSILCLGDSITAGSALPKPDGTRYADVTGKLLREKYGYKGVTSKSLAVGGANSWDVAAWVYRDFEEIPDVVTFMCGYNDMTSGMHPEVYRGFLELWVNRVTALSKGKTAIVLFTTIPGCGSRYLAHDKYAQVVREVAKKYGIACFDLNAIFKKRFTKQNIDKFFRDAAHPNPEGHRIIAENFADFLTR